MTDSVSGKNPYRFKYPTCASLKALLLTGTAELQSFHRLLSWVENDLIAARIGQEKIDILLTALDHAAEDQIRDRLLKDALSMLTDLLKERALLLKEKPWAFLRHNYPFFAALSLLRKQAGDTLPTLESILAEFYAPEDIPAFRVQWTAHLANLRASRA